MLVSQVHLLKLSDSFFCFVLYILKVLDISEMLYNYFKKTNFGDFQIVPAGNSDVSGFII